MDNFTFWNTHTYFGTHLKSGLKNWKYNNTKFVYVVMHVTTHIYKHKFFKNHDNFNIIQI